MKVGIVGLGHVGSAMLELFKEKAVCYDKYKKIGSKDEINSCEVVFVCVPTPQNEDGSCNTLAVEEVLSWLKVDTIVLRSTVPVGFTKKANEKYQSNIIFQPEYYGETTAHPFADLSNRPWITLGGENPQKAIEAYQEVYNSSVEIVLVDSSTAELAKYMENAFYALKVSFCNEFYDIAKSFNIDYNLLREVWLKDPRINRSHTFVFPAKRGYSGSCLPKDISSISYQAKQNKVDVTLIDAVRQKNKLYNPDLK